MRIRDSRACLQAGSMPSPQVSQPLLWLPDAQEQESRGVHLHVRGKSAEFLKRAGLKSYRDIDRKHGYEGDVTRFRIKRGWTIEECLKGKRDRS